MNTLKRLVGRKSTEDRIETESSMLSTSSCDSSDEEVRELVRSARRPMVRRPHSRIRSDPGTAASKKEDTDSSMSEGTFRRALGIADALSPSRASGPRIEKDKVQEAQTQSVPDKHKIVPKAGILPEGVVLTKEGRMEIPEMGLSAYLGSLLVPHVAYEDRLVAFDQAEKDWYRITEAEDLKRKAKMRVAKRNQTAEVIQLKEKVAQLEDLLLKKDKGTEATLDMDAMIKMYKGNENMTLDQLVANRSYRELPQFKEGDSYVDYLEMLPFWFMRHGFPKAQLHVTAVHRTLNHPSHAMLTNRLVTGEIKDWPTFKAAMKEQFAPKLSPEANLERISSLQMSDEEKRKGDFTKFDHRLQTELRAALEEVEGITQPVIQFLMEFLGKDFFLRGVEREVGDYIRLQLSVTTRKDAITAATKFDTQRNDKGELERNGGLVGAVHSAGGRYQGKGGRANQGKKKQGGRTTEKKEQPPQQSGGSGKKASAQELLSFAYRKDICDRCKEKAVQCGILVESCGHCHRCYTTGHLSAECPNRKRK